MNDDNWTEIICILDRSGSMGGLEPDTIGGFNAFLERQRAEAGRARLTLVLFDHEVEVPWEHVDLAKAPELDEKLYFVRGSTALLDAVGRTVNNTRGRLRQMHEDERPENVIVLVMTDGYENASSEYNGVQIKELVEETTAEGWDFVFIGAEIDAFGTAEAMSMDRSTTSQVAKTGRGMREAYSKLNRAVSQKRRTGSIDAVDDELDEDGWI